MNKQLPTKKVLSKSRENADFFDNSCIPGGLLKNRTDGFRARVASKLIVVILYRSFGNRLRRGLTGMADLAKRKETSTTKRWVFICIAIAIVAVAFFMPTPEGLEPTGKMALALLVAAVVLWVSEVLNIAVTAFAVMVFMYVFSISSTNDIWLNWASSPIFFVLAAFGISIAMLGTSLPNRIVFALLKLAKDKPRRVVLAFMIASWFMSMFISDFATTALVSGIAVGSVLELEKAVPGESKLGKCLLMGIPLASVVGGGAMPTGSAMNIMAMGMLQGVTGISISFLDWTLICLPMSIILLFASFLSLVLVFKPEPITPSTIQEIANKATEAGKLSTIDKKFLVVMGLVLVVWIASNWTGWDATIIALGGLVVFFLPGIDLLNWKDYAKGTSWEIIMMLGGINTLAAAITKKGAGSWLYNVTAGRFALTATASLVSLAIFLPLCKFLLPNGAALIAIFMVPLTTMATTVGISPVVIAIMLGINASNTFLIGYDANHMITYQYGYWTFVDFFKTGVPPTLVLMLLQSTVLPMLVGLLGY